MDVLSDLHKLTAALSSQDVFRAQAATEALAQSASAELLQKLCGDEHPAIRLGGLLASLKSPAMTAAMKEFAVGEGLRDPDAKIRQAALIAAGTRSMTGLRDQLDRALDSHDVSTVLFQTYLAAVECLQPEFTAAFVERRYDSATKIPRPLPDGLLAAIALDSKRPTPVRALAVRRLDGQLPRPLREMLWQWVEGTDPDLQLTAVRRLAQDTDLQTSAQLLRLAADGRRSALLRAEAILALSSRSDVEAAELIPLIGDAEATVAIEAARALKHLAAGQLPKLLRRLQAEGASVESISVDTLPGPAAEALQLALGEATQRPQSLTQWIERLEAVAGDPTAGRRVFYSPAATCSRCHTIGAAGGTLGPDLSNVAQSVGRGQIAQSILDPSQQFAPQYQAWQVLTMDGQLHTGLQLDHQQGGAINMLSIDGQTLRFAAEDIAEYQASEHSLMPTGLEEALTVSELADLLAFLESLR